MLPAARALYGRRARYVITAQGQPVSGQVDMARLSSLERQLLHDTLAVVQRFKQVLQQRLRLGAV